jgi:OOP family OmpA-OmpF porin
MQQVDQIGQALQNVALRQAKILIEGHTDGDGSSAYNQRLSERRAARIRKVLVERFNLDSGRFQVEGCGEDEPIASNDTPEGKAMNRRVAFTNLGMARD